MMPNAVSSGSPKTACEARLDEEERRSHVEYGS